ncbi:DUF6985 domain-containing protein [Frederiksenia canicola]
MIIPGLTFDYGWRKPIVIHFNNEETQIELAFDAYEGEDVNNKQESAYNEFLSNQAEYEIKIKSLLKDYIERNGIRQPYVQAKTLMFNQDGSFGLLCNCSWDIENGIVIILSPYEKITIQDEFI